MKVEVLTGDLLDDALDDIARLRLASFRDWPYLYVGNPDHERQYFQSFRDNATAIMIGAFDGSWLVGVGTGAPLLEHEIDFADAFARNKFDPADIFYCGESVLLPRYRNKGIGKQFFFLRELHARELGFKSICFCTVVRQAGHPLMPKAYTPMDSFWRARGYEPLEKVVARYSWRDIDQNTETQKHLQFWMKNL